MSYFSNMYSKICYPRTNSGLKGLRSAQIGAIHAIAAHDTLIKKKLQS
jgi:hypothetical protein